MRATRIVKIKQVKAAKANQGEKIFLDLMVGRGIVCIKLDDPKAALIRAKWLKNTDGKCPDFFCSKENKSLFVEVKTLTNFTNAKREKRLKQRIIEVFDPLPELKGPLTTFLKDTSDKFKNIKKQHRFPRIMFLEGVFGAREMIRAVYAGLYHAYEKPAEKLIYVGWRKTHRAVFDETGSNVSAVVWWDADANRFEGVSNNNAKIFLDEPEFNRFFG